MRRRRSLRVRITAAFTLFFTLGAVLLLSAAYLIVARSTGQPVKPETLAVAIPTQASAAAAAASSPVITSSTEAGKTAAGAVTAVRVGAAKASSSVVPFGAVQAAQADQSRSDLRRVLWWFIAALVAVICLSAAAGWVVAARALAPLRRITATAREVSGSTLDARIALAGPHDELRELAETFDDMLARLERAFLAQRRFVASASHELRTPLALARMEAELALTEDHASPAQLREALGQIHATIERGGDLVEALLQLAQAGETLPGLEPVALADVLTASASLVRPVAVAADVELELEGIDGSAAACRVDGRVPLLRALVDNLLTNAIAYNETGGWVRAGLRDAGGELLLTVTNSGPPVDPRCVEDLFEPFVRAEPSRSRRSGGAGLGLAIVRAVAAAHGGHVDAAARPDGGLQITIGLPVAAPHSPTSSATTTALLCSRSRAA